MIYQDTLSHSLFYLCRYAYYDILYVVVFRDGKNNNGGDGDIYNIFPNKGYAPSIYDDATI